MVCVSSVIPGSGPDKEGRMGEAVNVGVLVSGRGSNLQAILDAVDEGRLNARVKVVISDREDAYALERAARHRVEAAFVDPSASGSREDYDRALVSKLREKEVELVVLAGFMRILSPFFVESFENRVMNIHPALLPSFPGLHVQKKALDHGVKFSGCTVHFVDTGVDTGPVIIQAVVPVLDGDTEESLSERILRQEHRIYPRAIQLYTEGRLRMRGRRVFVTEDGGAKDHNYMVNPDLK
jgi:phosphoribosylglycinamide formyltransferase-1